MPILDCPDCSKQVSDAAPTCPHCGRPLRTSPTERQKVYAHPESTAIEKWGCKYPLFAIIALILLMGMLSLLG